MDFLTNIELAIFKCRNMQWYACVAAPGCPALSSTASDNLRMFINGGNSQMSAGGRQAMQGDSETPPDFSYWAAALGLIIAAAYLYYTQHFMLELSITGGLIAAYIIGSFFNSLMRLIVFVIKLALYTAILLVALYAFLMLIPKSIVEQAPILDIEHFKSFVEMLK